MLDILTFTGVDSYTNFRRMGQLAETYPKVEFGVLIGTLTRNVPDDGVFPPWWVLDCFNSSTGIWPNGAYQKGASFRRRCAIHLCGSWARDALHPNGPSEDLVEICKAFGRVQVNIHPDVGYPDGILIPTEIEQFVDAVPHCESVIFQHRGRWETIPSNHPRVEYLFDRSEGSGREAFDEWPVPDPQLSRMGYSGGIGPHNIDQAMGFLAQYPDSRMWLDMEGNVRTKGRFDLDKVEYVCQQVFGKRQPL